MMYKKPRYVDEIKKENRSIILFNRLSGAMAEIPPELSSKYEKCSHDGVYNIDNEYLIKNFFVDENQPENVEKIAEELLKKYEENNSLYITIMPTELCNFRCTYCYEEHVKGNMKEKVAQAIVNYIEKVIDEYSSLHIEWFGGEPTLALDIVEYISVRVIAICKNHRKPFTAGMTTNGYLLTLDVVRKLYAQRIFTYQITLDGDKRTHDKQRLLCNGGATFDVIVNNILNIQKNFKRKFLQFVIRTNITTSIIKDSLDDYLNFAQNILAPHGMVDFRFRIAWVGNDDSDLGIYINSEQECYQYLSEKLANMSHISVVNDYYGLLPYGEICYAANKNAIVFGSDGAIYKCTVHFEDEKNKIGFIDTDNRVIFDQEKLDVWHMRKPIEHKCYECQSLFSCLGIGCPYNCGSDLNCGTAITWQHEMIIRQHSLVEGATVPVENL